MLGSVGEPCFGTNGPQNPGLTENRHIENITFIEFQPTYKGRETSAVWDNFLRSENKEYAMCKICKKVLRCGSTALRYHLKRTHSIEVNIVKRNIWNKSDVEKMEFSYKPTKRTPSTLSSVWKYYSRNSDKNCAQCNICQNVLCCSGGTTTGLRKHLSSKHDIHIEKREAYQFIEVENDDTSSDTDE
uniref:SFRICE_004208 n=1 Tax=Spodoptera frugiperda TaxID=7108 RepID=A0A2H1VGJ8_SPOFR